ncbi:MAG TPA: MBL fold metallo-hydrolase [Anaerolineales bacterium]|nr:MBL fold metallo-hydrolase [Anaerolineales bacterium]
MRSELQQLTAHVYWLPPDATTDRPILGVVAGERRTLIVDAGNSPAHARLLRAGMALAGLGKGDYLALTHWHWDHIFGADTLGLTTFAHEATRQKIDEMLTWEWNDAALDRRVQEGVEIPFCRDMIQAEMPDRRLLKLRPVDIAYTEQVEIDLGGIHAQLLHVGGDHGADASAVYVPEDRVVFLGDCLGQAIYTSRPHYTIQRLFPLLDRLLALEVDYYLEGHNPQPAPRWEIEEYFAWMKTVGRIVQQYADDHEAAQAALSALSPTSQNDDPLELAELFWAGGEPGAMEEI